MRNRGIYSDLDLDVSITQEESEEHFKPSRAQGRCDPASGFQHDWFHSQRDRAVDGPYGTGEIDVLGVARRRREG